MSEDRKKYWRDWYKQNKQKHPEKEGNVRVISYRANRLKGDASIEELQSIINYVRGHSNENRCL